MTRRRRQGPREGQETVESRLIIPPAPEPLPDQMAAFGISGKRSGITRLFMSHPPLDARIAALERGGA